MLRNAWIVLAEGRRCGCSVSDISQRGARINVPDSETIPELFVLLFAENACTKRRCRVIWRKPRELGVKFETRLDERIRASLSPSSTEDIAKKTACPATEPA